MSDSERYIFQNCNVCVTQRNVSEFDFSSVWPIAIWYISCNIMKIIKRNCINIYLQVKQLFELKKNFFCDCRNNVFIFPVIFHLSIETYYGKTLIPLNHNEYKKHTPLRRRKPCLFLL